jgi:hypothetical protein
MKHQMRLTAQQETATQLRGVRFAEGFSEILANGLRARRHPNCERIRGDFL